MKKNMIFTILSIVCLTATADTVDWWNQPTVCKYNPNKCYTTMGAGFDSEEWDASANCRGMKYICPNALKQKSTQPELIGKNSIAKKTNADYDTNVLGETGDCFGTRKSKGTQVMVSGKFVNLYCHGVLDDDADETLPNGEIVYGDQPTCETLKAKGYIAVENGKCIGKYLDESKYYIQCGAGLQQPERIVLLNGAEIPTKNSGNITTQTDADKVFNKMYNASKDQKTQYFKK